MKRDFGFLIIFAVVIIFAAEWIGFQSITIGSITITLLPLVFAILLTMVLG